jgi:hypothetical protein
MLHFPGMLLRYFLNDSEMVPVSPTIIGITFVFTFHMRCIYYYYYYYYIIAFMLGIHTYIPETNHVSRAYSVAAISHELLMVHITLSSLLNSLVLLH